MDSVDSNEQRFTGYKYGWYMIFMAIVFTLFIKFIRVPDSNEQRLFSEQKYGWYMIFMAIVFTLFIKFIHVPVMISIKRIKISATLFFINFFVAWFALQPTTCVLVAHSYPIAFDIVFCSTMISAPAVLFYTAVQYPSSLQYPLY